MRSGRFHDLADTSASRRAGLVAVLVLVSFAALACVPYARVDQPGVQQWEPPAARVVFGGDSITVDMSVDLRQELAAETDWWSNVKAASGWTMGDFMAADDGVLNDPGFEPDAAVINIGTNDVTLCGQGPPCDPAQTATQLDSVWAPYQLSGVSCRIAVTVAHVDGATLNARINHLLSIGVVTHVADWHAHSVSHPEWFADPKGHLSADGIEAFSQFLVQQLEQACPAA